MCLAQGHNAVTPVRLEPAVPRSRAKHSTTEPLRSLDPFEHLDQHHIRKKQQFYYTLPYSINITPVLTVLMAPPTPVTILP